MPNRQYSSLRLRIVLTVLAFSLIPLLAAGSFFYREFDRAYDAKVHDNLRLLVDTQKRAIDMFLEQKIFLLKSMALTHSYDQLSRPEFLTTVFNTMQGGSRSFIDLGVIDGDGDHVAYVGPYNLRGVNYKDEEWFHKVRLRGLFISDVFTGFRRYPHFVIAVVRSEGSRSWVLRATIDSEVFNALVRNVQVGRLGDAYLINADGDLQTDSRFNGQVLAKAEGAVPSSFQGSRVERMARGGREQFVGMAWLDRKDWLLVIQEDPREGLSGLLRIRAMLAAITVLGMLLIGAGAIWVGRMIVLRVAEEDRAKAEVEADILQSSKMAALGKMAAGVAHEINNPLTLIRESAGWIKDLLTEEDPGRMRNYREISEMLVKIDQHVERAKTITHRMLGFAKRMDPILESVDVNSLAGQTVAFLQNEATFRNIAIDKLFDSSLPLISTDPAKLQQVILNLLENAIDAVGKDGGIAVSTGASGNPAEVWLMVKDSGPGIPKEMQSRIFDPFFTTKSPGEGTGLGLSICFSIIKELGGRIEVQSEPGHGAAFTIHLPRG